MAVAGLTGIKKYSVIGQNKYPGLAMPNETIAEVMGRNPRLLFDIHSISGVNPEDVDLAEIPGPATSETFESDPHAYGKNVTDIKISIGPNKQGTDSTNPNTP